MKKNSCCFLFIVIILTLTGCLPKQKRIEGLWFYTYTNSPIQNEDPEVIPASFLYLRNDGSYTRDFGQFDFGTWKRKDSLLILISNKGMTVEFPISDLSEMRST